MPSLSKQKKIALCKKIITGKRSRFILNSSMFISHNNEWREPLGGMLQHALCMYCTLTGLRQAPRGTLHTHTCTIIIQSTRTFKINSVTQLQLSIINSTKCTIYIKDKQFRQCKYKFWFCVNATWTIREWAWDIHSLFHTFSYLLSILPDFLINSRCYWKKPYTIFIVLHMDGLYKPLVQDTLRLVIALIYCCSLMI